MKELYALWAYIFGLFWKAVKIFGLGQRRRELNTEENAMNSGELRSRDGGFES